MQTIFFILILCVNSVAYSQDILKMRDLYNKDLSYSSLAKDLENKYISVVGFMAPPLKAELSFFVLTKMPLSVCPFCETDQEWPDDILVIYTKRIAKTIAFNKKIKVTGILKLGTFVDINTGFLSRIRIINAKYE